MQRVKSAAQAPSAAESSTGAGLAESAPPALESAPPLAASPPLRARSHHDPSTRPGQLCRLSRRCTSPPETVGT
jgi:hypothetical protein